MKIKNKKVKTKVIENAELEEYPEGRNPFADDYIEPQSTGNGKISRNRATSDAKGLKGKKTKIKKEKKPKKIKGKRERAVSRAVASQLETDGDSLRSRVPTIVLNNGVEQTSDKNDFNTKSGEKKAKKKLEKKEKKLKKKEEKKSRGKEKDNVVQYNQRVNKRETVPTAKDASFNNTGKVPTTQITVPKTPSANVTSKRVANLRNEDGYSSLPSAGKLKATSSKLAVQVEATKRHSTGDIPRLHEEKANVRDNLKLEVAVKREKTNKALSPIVESPITAVPEHVRPSRRRTGSMIVSSKERRKKKRLRLAKKWKRLKHKNDQAPEIAEVGSYDESLDFNPIRKPAVYDEHKVEELRDHVEEVKTLVASNVATGLEQRHSALIDLAAKADRLEEASHDFAKVATETRLKKQSQAKCCGIFSKYRVCWYICACQGRMKKRPKGKPANGVHGADTLLLSRANADADDSDDEPFALVDKQGFKQSNLSIAPSSTKRSSTSSFAAGIKNSKIYLSLSRTSLPLVGNMRSLGRMRKASSSGALEKDTRSRVGTRTKEEIEAEIQTFASKYEDGETRNRVTELLMLDHTNK